MEINFGCLQQPGFLSLDSFKVLPSNPIWLAAAKRNFFEGKTIVFRMESRLLQGGGPSLPGPPGR
jgi:hypothetical protein